MKTIVWLASLAILGYAVVLGEIDDGRHALVITGSLDGYLAPCGCTKPMSGGIKRRITAIRSLSISGKTTVVDNGGCVAGNGRQDEMKAETVAESMRLVKTNAINYGLEEVRLGLSMAATMDRLSGGALVSTGFASSGLVQAAQFKASGPFLIGGIDPRTKEAESLMGAKVEPVDDSVRSLVQQAEENGLVPVLMTRGDLVHAEKIAREHPSLRIIVCATKSVPLESPKRVGDTLIVSPGEHGKYALRIDWDGENFVGYRFIDLGPQYKDDESATRIYETYLARVGREDLLSMVPREPSKEFAGSEACAPCHPAAYKAWSESAHAHALSTLENVKHDKDPDCVGCHVVGLRSVEGFKSRAKTPLLTDVGCESCHGPLRAHVMNPAKVKPVPVGEKSCAPCHVPQHSPNFDFAEYWEKIAH